MISITGIPNLDFLIVAVGLFAILQLGTWIYKKYFSKDNVVVGGTIGKSENNSDKR